MKANRDHPLPVARSFFSSLPPDLGLRASLVEAGHWDR
jgi:hypothetical protein